jgi:signal-transduction protein with cAMP-binding, CBS, and nucleotidyltransferase domain
MMIPLVEPNAELVQLQRDYKRLCEQIVEAMPVRWLDWHSSDTNDLLADGLPPDAVVLLVGGTVEVMQGDKMLYCWDDGDIFLASDYALSNNESSVMQLVLGSDADFKLAKLSSLYEALAKDSNAFKLWQQWSQLQRQLLNQLVALLVQGEERPSPGFMRYNDGDVIIHEGDISDSVYTIMDGTAEVFVNNVKVGEIAQEEIFGAIAVLTGQRRTATVKARGACNVLVVSQTEFANMINTHPQLFMNLVKDMAKNIVSLNERVVSLAGAQTVTSR